MNNENKYQFINNLTKEYHHILWEIMIKAECNHSVDRPKELSEFKTPRKLIGYGMSCNYYSIKTLTKAPKSYQFIEVE